MPERAARLRRLSPEKRALLLQALRREAVSKRRAEAIPRRRAEVPAPASFGQQRLWLLDQLLPGRAAYNLPFAVRLSGRLEVGALGRSLAEVVRRHEVLRTVFVGGDAGALQVPAPAGGRLLAAVDLSRLPAPAREAEARRLARADARRPFDLACGPLLRATLLRLEARAHVLLFCLHHTVSDGWSNAVLLGEMSQLYAAFAAGEASPLPELELQFADFAVWQRQQLTGETLDGLLAYWRQKLRDAPPVLELPTDRARPAAPRHLGGTVTGALDAGTPGALNQLGRDREATPFVILLAAFQALLGRWAGSRDVVVGSPVAGRERPEVEGLIGFFANTLVLRTDLLGDPSFAELLDRVRRAVLEAQEHAELPFERLVEELRPERDEAVHPLFQVAFVLQDGGRRSAELPGLTFEPVAPREIHSGVAKFDLTLFVDLQAAGSELWLEYDRELFAATTASRFLRHLRTLLRGALKRPQTPLSELPWLLAAERHQLLCEWRSPAAVTDSEATVHGLFQAQARSIGEAIALESADGALSYGELDRRSGRLAAELRAMGVGPGTAVGVAMERSAELVVALVAILEAGGAYVPLDPAYPSARLALMLADSGVRVLLTLERHLPALAELPTGTARILAVDRARAAPEVALDAVALDAVSPDDLAYLVYTSGSTGRPKGVAVPHRAVVRLVRGANYVQLTPQEVVLQFAPVAFDASTLEIWGPLLNGARLALMPPGSPSLAELGAALRRLRVTTLWLTSGLFHQMVDAEAEAFGGVRQLLAGGDVLSAPHCRQLLRSAPGCRLINGYGPTENTTFTCCHPLAAAAEVSSPVPIGRPITGTRVVVTDAALRPLAIGVVGELMAGGDGVARGYAGEAALTAERFIPEPWGERPGSRMYRTGDRARYLPGGNLEFLGRGDHQVKVRGFRIEPEEIEAVLGEQPEVLRSAVVAQAGTGGDKRLVAFVVAAPGEVPAAAEAALFARLRSALAERLPDHMVPALWQTLPELPLNPNGKVDRGWLAEQVVAPGEDRSRTRAPATPVEEMLAGIWADVLGTEPAADDDFFALGGHSLLATRIVARVRQVFAVDLPLATVFEHPRLSALAAEIEARRRDSGAAEVSPLVPAEGRERRVLSFAQERLWILDRFEPGSPAFNISASVLLRGALDRGLLERALAFVANRHEILRTTFDAVDGEPFQRLSPSLDLEVPAVDLTALDEAARRESVARWSREVAATSFDLARGPLLRLVLLKAAPREHALLLAIHHIISDGWSIGLLIEELTAAYAALAGGGSPDLPPLAIQYADYAAWQRSQKEMLERQVGYWRKRLAGAPPAFELPTDHPRPGVRTYRGASWALDLEPPLSVDLAALARRRGATLFMVLLAALKILLQRWSGESDVVVGAPVAGRGRSEVEPLMGIFLNTLVLRTDLGGSPTFLDLLDRVRETALGAYSHQHVPFEKLLEELRPERDLSRTPLFQVFFNMLNLPRPAFDLPGLELETLSPPGSPAKFDLTFYVEERGEEIHFDLVYNRDLYSPGRMAELLEQYHHLLRQVAADPERPIGRLSLVTAGARARLPDPRRTLGDEWTGSVQAHFARLARLAPERPAVVAAEAAWTYAELEARANRLAHSLVDGGVRRGDAVAIHGRRDPRLVCAVLGALKAGAAFVILDPAHPAQRLIDCLRLAAPRGWIEVEPAPEALSAHLEACSARCRVILPPASDGADAVAGDPGDPGVEVGPEDLAYIAFTSGSTGVPKGILGRHGPLSHFTPWQRREFGLGESDRFSMLSGLSHDPLQRDMFTPLQIGGAISIPDPDIAASPGPLAAWMKSAGVTVAHLTPAMGQVLNEAGQGGAEIELGSLRYAFFVGDVLTRRDVARLCRLAPAITCINYYGSTETQRAVGYCDVTPAPGAGSPAAGGLGSGKESLPLGRGVENVQLLVLSRAGALAGIGEVGEIYVRSPHLARGYLRDPAATAERFVADPQSPVPGQRIYRTGDLGRYLPDGHVEFAGRADHQIKVRGFRIEPGEIEALIDAHPAVRQSVVLARDDQASGRRLVAYVAASPSEGPAGEGPAGEGPAGEELVADLRDRLRQWLPAPMIPSAFTILDRLPLNPNGKVDRAALARSAPGGGERRSEADYAPPQSEVERTIAAVLRELLGVERVGRRDSIFELGGDSLLAVRAQSRLREIFGRDIRLVELFTHPTVAALAAWLGEGEGRPAGPRRDADRSEALRLGRDRRRLRFEKLRRRNQTTRSGGADKSDSGNPNGPDTPTFERST